MRTIKWPTITLGILLTIALILRLYRINVPVTDWHSSEQASTLSVINNYQENGIDLFFPRHNDAYNYQFSMTNPEQYYFAEFPLYAALVASTYSILPFGSIEQFARIITVISSFIIILLLHTLVKKEYGEVPAIIAAGVYAIFPFFVFFSRVALSETFAVALLLISFYLVSMIKKESELWEKLVVMIPCLLFFLGAVMVKPAHLFFVVIPLMYLGKTFGLHVLKRAEPYLFIILPVVGLVLWSQHIGQYQEGITTTYLLSGQAKDFVLGDYIIPRKELFTDLIVNRVHTIVLGGFIGIFLYISFFAQKKVGLLHGLALASFTYLVVFTEKHLEAEHYQTLLLPTLAVCIGVGFSWVLDVKETWSRTICTVLFLTLIAGSIYVSFDQVRYYYQLSGENTQVSKLIQTLTQKDDRIVTDTDGNTTLLYLSNREGATTKYASFEEMKQDGYAYFATSKEERIETVKEEEETYKPVFQNDKLTLYQL